MSHWPLNIIPHSSCTQGTKYRFYRPIYHRNIRYRPVPIQFCQPKVGWLKNQLKIRKITDISAKYWKILIFHRNIESLPHALVGWNFRQNISKYRRYIGKISEIYLGKISEISEIYRQYFKNIDRAFDFLTNNLTAQIRSCFDPKVQISSIFFKKHPKAIFWIQRWVLNLKFDLTV